MRTCSSLLTKLRDVGKLPFNFARVNRKSSIYVVEVVVPRNDGRLYHLQMASGQ